MEILTLIAQKQSVYFPTPAANFTQEFNSLNVPLRQRSTNVQLPEFTSALL